MIGRASRTFVSVLSLAGSTGGCTDVLGIPHYHADGSAGAGGDGSSGNGGAGGTPADTGAPCGAPADPEWGFEGTTQGFFETGDDAPGAVSSVDGALRVSVEGESYAVWDALNDDPRDLRGKIVVACVALVAFDPDAPPELSLFVDTGEATRTGYSETVPIDVAGVWTQLRLDVDNAGLDGGSAPYRPDDVRSIGMDFTAETANPETPLVVDVSALWLE